MSSRHVLAAVVMLVGLVGCTPADSERAPHGATTTTASRGAATSDAPAVRVIDFSVTYRLEGVTQAGAQVPLVTDPRLRLETTVPDGAIASGAGLGQLRLDPAVRAELERSAQTSRIDAGRLVTLEGREVAVVAPVDGILDTSTLPHISSRGVDVVVALTPVQRLRYGALDFTGRATVETVVGQRQVTCAAVWLEETDVVSEAGDGEPAAQLHCRLPRHVETVPGLRAGLTLASNVLEDATVVPNMFIGYDAAADSYTVTTSEGDADPVTRPIDVGVTDGVVRVVMSELPEGARLHVPEAPAS